MRAVLFCLSLGSALGSAGPLENATSATVPGQDGSVSPGGRFTSAELERQAADLAKTDPERGIQWLDQNHAFHHLTVLGDRLLPIFVSDLVKADPQKAIALFDRFEPGRNRSGYASEVAAAVTTKDLVAAWEAYASKRKDPAVRPTAGCIIAIHCGKGVEKAWDAYRAHEPDPDKKLFLRSVCIAPGERSTTDTAFTLNMLRTVQSCAKCEAAFEDFVANDDDKDMSLLADYLAAHPGVEKFNSAYAVLARDHLAKKDPLQAAKWIKRMTSRDEALVSGLRNGIKTVSPKTQKLAAELVPEVLLPEKPPLIKGDPH